MKRHSRQSGISHENITFGNTVDGVVKTSKKHFWELKIERSDPALAVLTFSQFGTEGVRTFRTKIPTFRDAINFETLVWVQLARSCLWKVLVRDRASDSDSNQKGPGIYNRKSGSPETSESAGSRSGWSFGHKRPIH